jgi:hypothetical protein
LVINSFRHELNIYDLHVIDAKTGTSLSKYAESIMSFKFDNALSDEWIYNSFINSPQFQTAQKVFQIVTSGPDKLYVQSHDKKISLYSPILYEPASSISHFDLRYKKTEEYLMAPSVSTFSKKLFGRHKSIFGPELISLLGKLGYQTVLGNKKIELEIKPSE